VRLFETTDGQLINPLLVSACTVEQTGREYAPEYALRFALAGTAVIDCLYEDEHEAESEKKRYKEHFESLE